MEDLEFFNKLANSREFGQYDDFVHFLDCRDPKDMAEEIIKMSKLYMKEKSKEMYKQAFDAGAEYSDDWGVEGDRLVFGYTGVPDFETWYKQLNTNKDGQY